MLGDAFKAEVAANGGRLPPLGLKTLVRMAGRLWVKRKIFHGKHKLGGLFGIQVSLPSNMPSITFCLSLSCLSVSFPHASTILATSSPALP